MRISDWSSDVCSSDLAHGVQQPEAQARPGRKPYLMLGHSYYIDVNSVGTRFLLGKPTWAKFEDQRPFLASAWVAATHLFTIESIAGREMWARDHLGEIRRCEVGNPLRSEESRVGKECVSKWHARLSPVNKQKKRP